MALLQMTSAIMNSVRRGWTAPFLDWLDAKLNALTPASMQVGTPPATYPYETANDGWVLADGTNPLTCEKIRLVDQVTGQLVTVTVSNGSLVVT